MSDKIFLGTMDGTGDNGRIYLTKHKWDCDWYWAFGYLGNRACHFHIDSLFHAAKYEYDADFTNIDYHFESTWITQENCWIIRDLFIQAYALRKASDAYVHGGHQTSDAEPYRIKSETMVSHINDDLATLLDTIWDLLTEWLPNRYKK